MYIQELFSLEKTEETERREYRFTFGKRKAAKGNPGATRGLPEINKTDNVAVDCGKQRQKKGYYLHQGHGNHNREKGNNRNAQDIRKPRNGGSKEVKHNTTPQDMKLRTMVKPMKNAKKAAKRKRKCAGNTDHRFCMKDTTGFSVDKISCTMSISTPSFRERGEYRTQFDNKGYYRSRTNHKRF